MNEIEAELDMLCKMNNTSIQKKANIDLCKEIQNLNYKYKI
jgi:hypothetical protein